MRRGLLLTVAVGALAMASTQSPAAAARGAAAPQATTAEARLQAWDAHVRLDAASPFKGMRWRPVGPTKAGARVEAIAVPPGDTGTIYVGVGSGNVWKTANNGLTWTPIFEHESTFTIGDIAVSASNPDIVWVGTGETQPRHSGYSYAGTGVFKSSDGGRTWRNMGLQDTQHIGKVIIDPRNPDVVYVGAIGHFWSPNAERGVFKTTDGGRTWQHVLAIDDRTGVVDMAMDPSDPQTLYAWAWQLVSGPESGLYKTTDAGRTWKKVTRGLPAGPMGRAGLDVAPGDPKVVYAFIDNQTPGPKGRAIVGGEVYRSDDRGESWRKVNEQDLYSVFSIYGWKFCDVRVSPDNADEIYILGNRGLRSEDGGRTYEEFGQEILRVHDTRGKVLHLDQHEIWIDPMNPARVLLGNDGGLFMSYDRARTWLHLNDIPAAEFYFVATDMRTPFRIYGGTQDNAALYGPSDAEVEDATDDPWHHVYLDPWTGGDSFVTLPDPTDDRIIYYEHQNGAMRRMDITGSSVISGGPSSVNIAPRAPKGEPAWRFGWYTPFIISRFDPHVLYAGGTKLLKSLDRGDHWFAVSPDLSDPAEGERGVVPYGTITMISESRFHQGVLYVGTEGGTIWLTRDDGVSWTKVSEGLPRKWVSRVIASEHDAGTVYAAITGFRQDDFSAYLYVSTDFGRTWRSIVSNLPAESINVIKEDPASADILYVGTDGGVYVSLDKGATWQSLCATLPTTPVHDLTVQSRDHVLVAGTHGRSVWVLDVAPIEALTEEVRASDVHVFAIRPVTLKYDPWIGEPGDRRRRAKVEFSYYLKTAQPVTITVWDEAAHVVRTLQADGQAGINTGVWDLQIVGAGPGAVPRDASAGHYGIAVAAGGSQDSAVLRVDPAPRE